MGTTNESIRSGGQHIYTNEEPIRPGDSSRWKRFTGPAVSSWVDISVASEITIQHCIKTWGRGGRQKDSEYRHGQV